MKSNDAHQNRKGTKTDRGSALLVSLMVMVGLSLLGLGFVTISETENTISANERNYAQALSVAEAGARLALEWFQAPEWAETQGLLAPNHNALKISRTTVISAATYTGRYKSDPSMGTPYGRLFDKPFKPRPQDRFYGTEDNPDVRINATTLAATPFPNFLDTFNAAITADATNGRVTEIIVYAPPIVAGAINAQGFWEGGNRYGLATIRVTARKFIATTVVAERTVKMVVSEWPFPGPQGPVQSNANISTGGNFGVHWGKMTSSQQMEIKRPLVGLPWLDPWSRAPFENGYFLEGFDDKGNATGGGPTPCTQFDWITRIYGVSFEDPWYEARARGPIINAVAGVTPQPFRITNPAQDILNEPNDGYSNWFQLQTSDDLATCTSDRRFVLFPAIDYEFWKNLSQSATSTTSSVKYLRPTGGEDYTDGITTQKMAKWLNTARATNPAKPGFYFFDTKNGLNPQGVGAPGVLADPININSSDDGSVFMMKGFIYLNTSEFGTTGIRGPGGWYNFPGEPYRDIGHEEVDPATGDYIVPTKIAGKDNGEFTCQDLNQNGVCDIYLAASGRTRLGPGGGAYTGYFPVKYQNGCTPGFNFVGGANCSEPHEPFLNIIYPTTACCAGGGAPTSVTIGWENPAGAWTARRKTRNTAGNPVNCTAGPIPPATGTGPNSPDQRCTSNGYDKDGGLVNNFGGTEPIMDGVLYNEGNFDTQGNAAYFGSILIQGNIIGTGTPEVWFDEFLVKGGWQDKFPDLPRVFVSAHETDQ